MEEARARQKPTERGRLWKKSRSQMEQENGPPILQGAIHVEHFRT